MNTGKIKEALAELQQERGKLDGVISQLQNILASANGTANTQLELKAAARSSYVDETVSILEHAGKPMHVTEITKKIASARGKAAARTSVESSIVRHINTQASKARITRIGPSMYGLSAWKNILRDPQAPDAA